MVRVFVPPKCVAHAMSLCVLTSGIKTHWSQLKLVAVVAFMVMIAVSACKELGVRTRPGWADKATDCFGMCECKSQPLIASLELPVCIAGEGRCIGCRRPCHHQMCLKLQTYQTTGTHNMTERGFYLLGAVRVYTPKAESSGPMQSRFHRNASSH